MEDVVFDVLAPAIEAQAKAPLEEEIERLRGEREILREKVALKMDDADAVMLRVEADQAEVWYQHEKQAVDYWAGKYRAAKALALAELREGLLSEEAKRSMFTAITEGNFLRFDDPEGQEEFVWGLIDAGLIAALATLDQEGDSDG